MYLRLCAGLFLAPLQGPALAEGRHTVGSRWQQQGGHWCHHQTSVTQSSLTGLCSLNASSREHGHGQRASWGLSEAHPDPFLIVPLLSPAKIPSALWISSSNRPDNTSVLSLQIILECYFNNTNYSGYKLVTFGYLYFPVTLQCSPLNVSVIIITSEAISLGHSGAQQLIWLIIFVWLLCDCRPNSPSLQANKMKCGKMRLASLFFLSRIQSQCIWMVHTDAKWQPEAVLGRLQGELSNTHCQVPQSSQSQNIRLQRSNFNQRYNDNPRKRLTPNTDMSKQTMTLFQEPQGSPAESLDKPYAAWARPAGLFCRIVRSDQVSHACRPTRLIFAPLL